MLKSKVLIKSYGYYIALRYISLKNTKRISEKTKKILKKKRPRIRPKNFRKNERISEKKQKKNFLYKSFNNYEKYVKGLILLHGNIKITK